MTGVDILTLPTNLFQELIIEALKYAMSFSRKVLSGASLERVCKPKL